MVKRTELRTIENKALLKCPSQPINVIYYPMKILSQRKKINLKLMKRRLLKGQRVVRLREG